MAARRARVTAAYATVRILDPATDAPSVRGFYKDAVLPEAAFTEDVERLVRREYAEWIDDVPGPADPGATIGDEGPKSGPHKDVMVVEPTDETDDGLAPQRPGDNASKAAWVDYAVATRDEGVSEDEARAAAEGMTKADLITLHG